MKKIVKRLLAVVMVVIFALSCTVLAFAGGDEQRYYEGVFRYYYSSYYGCAVIEDCDASATGVVTIPATLGGYRAMILGAEVFNGCNEITGFNVEEGGLYSVDEYGVLFNKEKTEIVRCPIAIKLDEYIIPDGVKTINYGAFSWCKNLKKIFFSDSVTEVNDAAFSYCENLENVYISQNAVFDWSWTVFEESNKLKNIIVDEKNNSYSNDEYGVLFNKDKTELIKYPNNSEWITYNIPDSVNIIRPMAFENCNNLKSVIIPDSVTYIGYSAFENCSNFESIVVPANVTEIYRNAFTGQKMIIVDDKNQNYSADKYGVLFNKTKTELISYPTGNQRTSYTIPNSVTKLGQYSFDSAINITNITIPNSVTIIANCAFKNCENLSNVYYSGTETEWRNIRYISEIPENAVIHFNINNEEISTTKPAVVPTTAKPTTTKPTTTKPSVVPTTRPTVPTTTRPASTTKPFVEEENIKKPSTSTVNYGETLILHINASSIPENAKIEWSVDGEGVTLKPSADGKTCAVTSTATGDVTVTAKYVDSNGVEHISEQKIESNAGLWQKIVSFFKNLFGMNRVIEQRIKFN